MTWDNDITQILSWAAYIACGYYIGYSGTSMRDKGDAFSPATQTTRTTLGAASDCKSCGAPLRAADHHCSYCGTEPST